jgi:hypothetical protein
LGSDLHQVNASLAGHVDGLLQGVNPQLAAVSGDNPDFPGTDFPR